jgi:hypothetical protein
MQTIDFLRNFFIKGLEIHSSFYCFFLDFFKVLKIEKIQNFDFLKFEKSSNFEFKNLPNFKPVRKGQSHSQQKHLLGCFQNCTTVKHL